jgi:hypothetical protein
MDSCLLFYRFHFTEDDLTTKRFKKRKRINQKGGKRLSPATLGLLKKKRPIKKDEPSAIKEGLF